MADVLDVPEGSLSVDVEMETRPHEHLVEITLGVILGV